MKTDAINKASESEARFDELVCELTTRLEAGESVDIEQLAAAHPAFSQRLHDLFPTLQAIHELGHSLLAGSAAERAADAAGRGGDRHLSGSLGDFRLIREIGRGGMGVVFEAEQMSLGRRVALKILPFAGVLNSRQLQRFKNEALAAAQLDHPHIVDVLGVGCERSVHYYAMRLIDGKPLSEIIGSRTSTSESKVHPKSPPPLQGGARGGSRRSATKPLTQPRPARKRSLETMSSTPSDRVSHRHGDKVESMVDTDGITLTHVSGQRASSSSGFFRAVAQLGIEVAEALDFAHDHGVIHRDIKPANLLVDNDGCAWITDFGLAHFDTNSELTLTGDLVGTLRYMSPEQALGKRVVVDHRTDVYSLGATLYELIAGQPAFGEEERSELIRQISFEEPKPLRQLSKAVPTELATVVHKCMAKNATDRYNSAIDLAEDLRCFLDFRPIKAKAPTLLDQTVKWAIRHRTTVSWLGVLLIVTSVVSTISAFYLGSERTKVMEALRQSHLSQWDSYIAQIRARRQTGQAGQRFEGFDNLNKAIALIPPEELTEAQRLELRNETVALAALTDIRLKNRLSLDENAKFAILDTRFERLAIANDDGSISIEQLPSRQTLITLSSGGASVSRIEFSTIPDRLAVKYQVHADSPATFIVWNLKDGVREFESTMLPRGSFDICRDGTRFATIMEDHTVNVHDMVDGQVKHQLTIADHRPRRLVLSPDGKKVAIAIDQNLDIFQLSDSTRVASLGHPAPLSAIAWSPDGRHLATGCNDFCAYVWNLGAPDGPIHVLRRHQTVVVNIDFDHKGQILATYGHDGITHLWNPMSGRCECSIVRRFPYFSHHGSQLCMGSTTMRHIEIYDVEDSAVNSLREGRNDPGPYCVDVSDCGRFMITGGPGGFVLWDLAEERTIAKIPERDGIALFHERRRELITVSPLGVLAWPMVERRNVLRIGPPRNLGHITIRPNWCRASLCPQRNQIAVLAGLTRIVLVDVASGHTLCEFSDKLRFEDVALSPNGKWLATTTILNHRFREFRVWDVASQRVIKTLERRESYSYLQFTPNGEFLVTSSAVEGYRIWNTNSWESVSEIPVGSNVCGPLAFSPNSPLAVFAMSRFHSQLVDMTTWKQVVRMEVPGQSQISCFDFTPTGDVIEGTSARVIRRWNFDRIRETLKGNGIDWPVAHGVTGTDRKTAEPFKAQIDFGEQWRKLGRIPGLLNQARAATQKHEFTRAIALWQQILSIDSNDPRACNALAWLLVTGPEEHRNPDRALSLSLRSVDRGPSNANYLNTLGVAQYRTGDFTGCISTLETAINAHQEEEGTAYDFLFLSLAHAKLGHTATAREWLQRAEAWCEGERATVRAQLQNDFEDARQEIHVRIPDNRSTRYNTFEQVSAMT